VIHPAVVVDASVWVSQVSTREVHHIASRDWMIRYLGEGGTLIAPALLPIEVASAIARRTSRLSFAKRVASSLSQRASLTLVALDSTLLETALDRTVDLRLRAGDALYVAVAYERGIPLVSWDNEQLSRSSTLVQTFTPDKYPF
jgi:predicted nucleic acid-binding protein